MNNIQLNDYFEYGRREVSFNEFKDTFLDIYDNVVDVINMFIGTIYYGNYNSCEYILNNYDFNQFIYNQYFIHMIRRALYQLQEFIEDEDQDQEAINTRNLVYENFPYREDNFIDNPSDNDNYTESIESEIIVTGYDSF